MKTHEKPAVITADIVMQVRCAPGMGVLDAKQLLETASPLFYSRFIEAILSDKRRYNLLYDPIEDKSEFAAFFKEAQREAEEELRVWEEEFNKTASETVRFMMGRGRGLGLQARMQRILQEKYNIEWFTLPQMNPGCLFD